MDLFSILSLIGGLSLFLFGMNLMGNGLEKSAGGKLKSLLERLTTKKLNGFLLGMGVTAIIQSSSATTVMVVGFVNSGIMSLKQAIHVIMGANVGTTVTAWLLSLTGIESSNLLVQLLKPSSFTPILALIGIVLYSFIKSDKKKDVGLILLGFTVLIYGMDTMAAAVKPLGDNEAFRNVLLLFSNPLLGVLAGAVLTGIFQSSSASVGILQTLTATGQVTVGTSIPIIMGQNIGTCVTALISSVGTNKNARRAAVVHLYFNLIGTAVFLVLFVALNSIFKFTFVNHSANYLTIAVAHSVLNILTTAILLPFSGLLEKLALKTIKDDEEQDKIQLLDSRLFSTPFIAISRSDTVAKEMARTAAQAIKKSTSVVLEYDDSAIKLVREAEQKTDTYEDALGSYLVKLSRQSLAASDKSRIAEMLYLIGEFERLADYALIITKSAEEINEKKLKFSPQAELELRTLMDAVDEIVELAVSSYENDNVELAAKAAPLEQVIDEIQSNMKKRHISRLQAEECTIELGFVFSDLITILERTADRSASIARRIIEISKNTMKMHQYQDKLKSSPDQHFLDQYKEYSSKYALE